MTRTLRRWTFAVAFLLLVWLVFWRPQNRQSHSDQYHVPLSINSSDPLGDAGGLLSVVSVCDIGILLGLERAIPLQDVAEVILSCSEDDFDAFRSFWTSMAATFHRPIRIVK